MKIAPITLTVAAFLAVSGCGTDGVEQSSSTAADQEAAAPEPAESPSTSEEPEETSEEPEPEPEPEPEREPLDVHQVGDMIQSPTADLVVNVIEQRDSIAANYEGPIEPAEGERLWYVDITWTNNLPEAVGKECHGPYSMQLHAFDLEGREMLMTEQPGFIEGQECTTGLMQGQTGTWQSAFHSLDEDFGWLVFDDYNGEPVLVVLDPDLELFLEP